MDIETRLENVEGDVEHFKVQCAVAHASYASKTDLQEAKGELKTKIDEARLEFRSALNAATAAISQDMHGVEGKVHGLEVKVHALEVKVEASLHALEVKVEASLHAQTWRLLSGMFGMLSATVGIVYYLVS